jgi:hypothetical protein
MIGGAARQGALCSSAPRTSCTKTNGIKNKGEPVLSVVMTVPSNARAPACRQPAALVPVALIRKGAFWKGKLAGYPVTCYPCHCGRRLSFKLTQAGPEGVSSFCI